MSIFVNNVYSFMTIKIIGILVIIMMISKIYAQNKYIASIGMRVLLVMMLFVVGNNIYIISAKAIPFNSFSGTVGTVANGNGYFDDELLLFNISTHRNVYVVTEPTIIAIVEPVSYPLGISSAPTILRKGDSNLRYGMVASDGYLYYIDSTGVKKKVSRSNTLPSLANDTGIGGTSQLIYPSSVVTMLYEYQQNIYFFAGTTLYYFPMDGVYAVSTYYTNVANSGTFVLAPIGGVLTTIIDYQYSAITIPAGCSSDCWTMYNKIQTHNVTSDAILNTDVAQYNTNSGITPSYSSMFQTNSYIFVDYYIDTTYVHAVGPTHHSRIYRKSNLSLYSTDFYTTGLNYKSNGFSLGSYSTLVLYAASSSTYNIFNFIEPGVLNTFESTLPADIQYTTATVNSQYTTYYNTSNFIISDVISIDTGIFSNNFWVLPLDYRWQIDIIDPNGVHVSQHISGQCTVSFFACNLAETLQYTPPAGNWQAGLWYAKLYEIKANGTGKALIATSPTWTVLNASFNNSGTVQNPTPTINSGTGSITLGIIDGFVGMLGMGVNPVTKMLFALIVIGMCMMAGFVATHHQVFGGVIIGLIPYLFFTFIEYLPVWGVVILGVVVAIKIGFFR